MLRPLSKAFSSDSSATGPWEYILPPQLRQALIRASEVQNSDKYWMKQAWAESVKNNGLTQPNPSVGCILVNSTGKEISRGVTQPFPGQHAEKEAFDKITDPQSLNGATAYVTLEPCSHFGNHPPCVDLFTHSPIRRIVVARPDPNPLVLGQGIQRLRAANKEVNVGILSDEVTAWNLGFLTQQTLNRPLIALKWAQTLDGQLADDSLSSQWISSPTSRAYTHWLRQHYDLIAVGAKTVLTDAPRLNVRNCIHPEQAQPLPVVLDPKGILLNIPREKQDVLKTTTFPPGRKTVLITSQAALHKHPQSWMKTLKDLTILQQTGQDWIPAVVEILNGPTLHQVLGRKLQSILIEGGSQTLTQWMAAGHGDIFHTFIGPLITGGEKNRLALKRLLKDASKLHTLSTSQLESDLLIEMISEEIKQRVFQYEAF